MLKNVTQLKCVVNSKDIILSCDNDCSIMEVKEAIYQFMKYIGQIEDAAKLQQEQAKVESEEKEESKKEPKIEQLQA